MACFFYLKDALGPGDNLVAGRVCWFVQVNDTVPRLRLEVHCSGRCVLFVFANGPVERRITHGYWGVVSRSDMKRTTALLAVSKRKETWHYL